MPLTLKVEHDRFLICIYNVAPVCIIPVCIKNKLQSGCFNIFLLADLKGEILNTRCTAWPLLSFWFHSSAGFCAAVKLDDITQQFKKRCRREGVHPP